LFQAACIGGKGENGREEGWTATPSEKVKGLRKMKGTTTTGYKTNRPERKIIAKNTLT
jgi:hypothetical protein